MITRKILTVMAAGLLLWGTTSCNDTDNRNEDMGTDTTEMTSPETTLPPASGAPAQPDTTTVPPPDGSLDTTGKQGMPAK